jgi:hypothetical protein
MNTILLNFLIILGESGKFQKAEEARRLRFRRKNGVARNPSDRRKKSLIISL